MAFRSGKRKDVKKQSYYVWFLGAKESKGLRGEDYIEPVLRYLLDKERENEPMKVTLQVSNKGMKIIQNVPRKNNKGKTEQIKHFIPHHAITCVLQEAKPDDDIVCCILLIYNPLTKCPVHVHTYRCDSVETASTLRTQLQILIDRPENQKKFREIENRLAAKGLLPARKVHSDGRSTQTDGSDRTEDSFGSERDAPVTRKDNIANLYDSLAAELRERLGNPNSCPILLPPKDYDTISRRRGKLDGIDTRRSTNLNIVGLNPAPKPHKSSAGETGSSGKSSGIGSDEALSSAIQEVTSHPDFESKEYDPESSSEEEDWPEPEPVAEEDEVIKPGWRKVPPRGQGRYRLQSHSPSTPTPRPVPPPSSRSAGSQPQFVEDNRYHKYHQREPPATLDNLRNLNIRDAGDRQRIYSQRSDNIRRFREGRDDHHQPKPVPVPNREAEVVYRRHSSPLERKIAREARPVSYPNGPPSSRPTSRPASPRSEHRQHQPVPPVQYEHDRPARNEDRRSYYGRQLSEDIPMQHKLQETPSKSPYRDHVPYQQHYHQSEPYHRPNSPDLYIYRRGPPQDGYVHRAPDHRRETYVDERRRSAYFDLPVDHRDYRHSFAEVPHRRLPLGSQY